MRPIDLIVLHCSATPNGRFNTVEDIDAWHRDAGYKRAEPARAVFNSALRHIGYHFVIYTNGALATGRAVEEVGAHAAAWNQRSIGICLLGTDKFSPLQWQQAAEQVRFLARKFDVPLAFPNFKPMPPERVRGVCGHRDLPGVSKTCPGFSVREWLAADLTPPASAVLR